MTTTSTVAWPKLKRDLVAILRGVKPSEIDAMVDVLVEAGFEAIEIPLNSPDPFLSIEMARKRAPADVLIGAGTVLTTENVDRLNEVGGNILVTPNTDPDVIRAAGGYGMVTMIGAFTATEALTAIKSGASAIKFFPANILGPKGIAGIKTILPPHVPIGAVGGVSEVDFADYMQVGVRAFGLGSSLYKPGATTLDVAARAKLTIEAYDKAVSA